MYDSKDGESKTVLSGYYKAAAATIFTYGASSMNGIVRVYVL